MNMRGSVYAWLLVAAFSLGATMALAGMALWKLVLKPWLKTRGWCMP